VSTTLLLVRHGETDWNREHRFQGHADQPLNEAGRAQARVLATELGGDGVAAVYTSPLARAHETAEIIAASLALTPQPDARLMEIDVGSWTGLTVTEVEQRSPAALQRWREQVGHGWDDGETYEDLAVRVLQALREIARRHEGQTVLVVGHGGTIRVTLAHAAGIDMAEHRQRVPPLRNCSIHRVLVVDGLLRVG
jgi:probable phosphoglycerate mutase